MNCSGEGIQAFKQNGRGRVEDFVAPSSQRIRVTLGANETIRGRVAFPIRRFYRKLANSAFFVLNRARTL